jgi:general secretion pathway protein K
MRAFDRRKRRRRATRERGAALVMVLLALVVMTVFLTEVQSETSTAFSSAIASRDRLIAEYHARSAINLSRLLLALEPRVRNAIKPLMAMIPGVGGGRLPQIPVWEFADQVLGAYNDADGAESFAALAGVTAEGSENLGLGGTGHFELAIVDEDSKINVNTAARGDSISTMTTATQLMALMSGPQYDSMFEQLDPDGQHSDRRTVCAALVDWADYNQDVEPCDPTQQNQNVSSGVEDNFYQTLGLDYFRKNAAFDSLEEVRLVRGINEDFWATFVDPDPRKPRKRVLTVWGQGKINVNSANAQTLYGVICANAPDHTMCSTSPGFDPTQALSFLTAVQMIRDLAGTAPLFGSANDFIQTMQGGGMLGPLLTSPPPPEGFGAGIPPVTFKSVNDVKRQITTESKMFSIYAEGVVPDRQGTHETRVSIHAVIDFRNAADLVSQVAGQQGTGGQSGSSVPPEISGLLGPNAQNPAAGVAAAQQAKAGADGTVVYYRIQ